MKAAYFAVVEFDNLEVITLADLRAAALTAPELGVAWPSLPGNPKLHDLRAWAELLVATRDIKAGSAYEDPGFGAQIVARADILQRLWSEVLRYRKNVAYEYEVKHVQKAAAWLLSCSLEL